MNNGIVLFPPEALGHTDGINAAVSDGTVSVRGTADYPLLALSLYGKSTQDGTPTPDEPVDIVSIGDDGAVEVTSCGKNLYEGSQDWSGDWVNNTLWATAEETYKGLMVKTKTGAWLGMIKLLFVNAGRKYVFSSYIKTSVASTVIAYANWGEQDFYAYPRNISAGVRIAEPDVWQRVSVEFVCTQSGFINPRIELAVDDIQLSVCGYQLEESAEMTDYEPYKGNTAEITSGLPLCSVGDVRDELTHNIDGTGKIIKRTGVVTFDGSDDEKWTLSSNQNRIQSFYLRDFAENSIKATSTDNDIANVLCDRVKIVSAVETWLGENEGFSVDTQGANHLRISSLAGNSDLTAWTSWLASNPLTVVYQLAEPQEIELSAAEMSALRALQSYSGVTNVCNDEGAEMSVKVCTNTMLSEYVYPIIKGQQVRIEELEAAVLSLGGNV